MITISPNVTIHSFLLVLFQLQTWNSQGQLSHEHIPAPCTPRWRPAHSSGSDRRCPTFCCRRPPPCPHQQCCHSPDEPEGGRLCGVHCSTCVSECWEGRMLIEHEKSHQTNSVIHALCVCGCVWLVKPVMQVPLPEHTTPASSTCKQLWIPHPLKWHDAKRLSFPTQWTSSIQIVPVPAGYSLKPEMRFAPG